MEPKKINLTIDLKLLHIFLKDNFKDGYTLSLVPPSNWEVKCVTVEGS